MPGTVADVFVRQLIFNSLPFILELQVQNLESTHTNYQYVLARYAGRFSWQQSRQWRRQGAAGGVFKAKWSDFLPVGPSIACPPNLVPIFPTCW